MDEARKILEFEVTHDKLIGFMENNRIIMVSEIVTAAEEMLYTEVDIATVCKIRVKKAGSKTTIHCKLTIEDLFDDIDSLLEWTVEKEEYELSHRIKLLMDYIKENDIRRKTQERLRNDETWSERKERATKSFWNSQNSI
jgi:hypothetical protein